jgi:large subunit ribosomal protein L24
MPTQNHNIRKNDEVIVIAGKDRSAKNKIRRGKVLSVEPTKDRLTIDGINIRRKAVRGGTAKVRQGGIIETPGPVNISNVMLICPNCDKPTRVSHRAKADERDATRTHKIRVCKKCGKDIDA